MSKFDPLWQYIRKRGEASIILSFDEISDISGVPIDHSFLSYKRELIPYGYEVKKISMKARTVSFSRIEEVIEHAH